MARSDVFTLLPLDQFAEIMGFDNWQFNQIKFGIDFHRETQCETVWFMHQWQRQFLSIDEIALAISSAENALAPLLNYYPAPKYIVNDDIPYPIDYRLQTPDWLTPRGLWKPLQTSWQYLQALGTLTRTLIEADVTYVTSDADNDNVDDTFTVTVNTTETDASKLRLYFSSGDRTELNETWLIRPVRVTADGTTATFVGKLPLLVDPVLKEKPNPDELDASDSGIYVETVDAYILSYDSDLIGTAYWDNAFSCGLTSGGINPDTLLIKPKDGYVRLIIDGVFTTGHAPNRVSLNYLAGYPYDSNGRMQLPYAAMVARLAPSFLPSLSCGCQRADQAIAFWGASPADGEQSRRPLSLKEIDNNSLPTTRGGIYAWSMIEMLQHVQSARS